MFCSRRGYQVCPTCAGDLAKASHAVLTRRRGLYRLFLGGPEPEIRILLLEGPEYPVEALLVLEGRGLPIHRIEA